MTDICAICQQELKANLQAIDCMHTFHKDCIETWVERKPICPICKHDISVPIKPSPELKTEPNATSPPPPHSIIELANALNIPNPETLDYMELRSAINLQAFLQDKPHLKIP